MTPLPSLSRKATADIQLRMPVPGEPIHERYADYTTLDRTAQQLHHDLKPWAVSKVGSTINGVVLRQPPDCDACGMAMPGPCIGYGNRELNYDICAPCYRTLRAEGLPVAMPSTIPAAKAVELISTFELGKSKSWLPRCCLADASDVPPTYDPAPRRIR